MADERKSVVIVGGGFAGVAAAKRLRRHAGTCRVTMINETNYTTFSPMLPEVVSTSVQPDQVIAPLRDMLAPDQRFVMGHVEQVDLHNRRVTCRDGDFEETIPFDHLVLALGSRAKLDVVPGLADNAVPLKLIGDAMQIRNQVIARLEQADHTDDPQMRRRLAHVVVVGGGFSGVEVAGEIHDFVRGARRAYPHVGREEPRVSVIHAGDRILPELPEGLARRAKDSMSARGITFHLGARARSADPQGIAIEDADGNHRRIEAATLVSTIGTAPNPLVERLDLPTERGRIVVRPDMSVEGVPGVWAIGDCAAVPNTAGRSPAPTTAQFATREAPLAADNIAAACKNRQTRSFGFGGLGTIATTGCQRGVANVKGVPVSGFPAWLLWRAFYLMQMPTLSRKLRIYVAWTWDMFFPRDVAQLSFAASQTVDQPASAPFSGEIPEGTERHAAE